MNDSFPKLVPENHQIFNLVNFEESEKIFNF